MVPPEDFPAKGACGFSRARCLLVIEAAPQRESKRLTIVSLSGAADAQPEHLVTAVRAGLRSRPRSLPWQFFYDEHGSRLFDRICGLPEYYLTRTEDAILRDHASAMVTGWSPLQPPCLLELGSGSAVKTQRLIAAALQTYGTLHYIPIDVSATFLEESAR